MMRTIKIYVPPGQPGPFQLFIHTGQLGNDVFQRTHLLHLFKLLQQIVRLSQIHLCDLKEPHFKHFVLEKYNQLYELREKNKVLARIIFTIRDGDIILLAPFIKRQPRDTMKALEQSLKNLLLQKPLNKITISDIADDCGINRMTFYYHFKDIYDLVEWSCQEDAAKALAGKKTYETWQQGFEQIFEAVLANKPFIMNVYHSVSREQVENYLYKVTYDLLEGVVEEQAQGMSVRGEDKAFIATVYKYAFVGLMLDWIKRDMKDDPQALVDRLELVIHGSVRTALERLRIDKPQ